MDKLQERAIAFNKLLDYQYRIKLGRKGILTEFILNFEKTDFFHLIGLHKLTDLSLRNISSKKIFDNCLCNNITHEDIASSTFFHSLGNRYEYFHKLEKMLDRNDMIFKCNNKALSKFSRITADFELKNQYENLIFYLFIEKRKRSPFQCCKSFINDNIVDYTYEQTRMTLLYKEKINTITGDSIIQYNRLSLE